MAGPYFVPLNGIEEAKRSNTPIRTYARQCTILPNFVGYVKFVSNDQVPTGRYVICRLKVLVHNGLTFLPVDIREEMVGYKVGHLLSLARRRSSKCLTQLGDFAPTKKTWSFSRS